MKKLVTIWGTRPELIRLSALVPKLDRAFSHRLVWTGQNHDPRLSTAIQSELEVRPPDAAWGVHGTLGEQLAAIFVATERLLHAERPDGLLLLGDTNSALSAIVATRMGVPVLHMEAGNRCNDPRVPEEVNRRVIDHASALLLPYTERSKANLVAENVPSERIRVTGNPIFEVIAAHDAAIARSTAARSLGVEPNGYILVTLHRAETVDDRARLGGVLRALVDVARAESLPVLVSTHPRTRDRMRAFGLEAIVDDAGGAVRLSPPFGFFDFIALERGAACVLTDSGTVQEECTILRVPHVCLRDATERPETVDCGATLIAGTEPSAIVEHTARARRRGATWEPPSEYVVPDVSARVVAILEAWLAG